MKYQFKKKIICSHVFYHFLHEFLNILKSIKGYPFTESVDLFFYRKSLIELNKFAPDLIIEALKLWAVEVLDEVEIESGKKRIVKYISGFKGQYKNKEGVTYQDCKPLNLPEKSHPTDDIRTKQEAIEYLLALPVQIRKKGEINQGLIKRFEIADSEL